MPKTILLLLALYGALQAQDRPNILLIIADDLGVDPLNGYHEADLKAVTPTLDSLRAAGITFTNAAASPVCSPTRAAIMSGQYGVKNGVLGVPGNLADSDNTIFKNLAAQTGNAYADALIGKWHLTNPLQADDPPTYGPDTYDGFLRGGVDDFYAWSRIQNGTAALSTEYVTTALTNSALSWIGEQTQPWFLWLAHAAPHSPYHVPPEGMYSIGNTGNNARKYIAMIEALDFEVGRMLSTLGEEVRDNTLVIFVGDNGTPNNVMQDYPNGHGKATLYPGRCDGSRNRYPRNDFRGGGNAGAGRAFEQPELLPFALRRNGSPGYPGLQLRRSTNQYERQQLRLGNPGCPVQAHHF
jgi:arylsulfatase B